MATYDDFDGVYFTVQSLRMYHPEVASQIEILVLDNHPENDEVAKALAGLANWIPGYRYVPNTEVRGTAARDLVFREAECPYVMCIDSHILIAPGGLAKLIEYFERHPGCADLLQGLRWLHRFPRPRGTSYRNVWEDRIRNYMIALDELGSDTRPMEEHFAARIGEAAARIVGEARTELASPFHYFDAIYCINLDRATERWRAMQARFERLAIGHSVQRVSAIDTPESHHIGCALTHRQILERARQRGLANVLVFEDDAIFLDTTLEHLTRSVAELEGQPWQIFYLGGHKWGNSFKPRPG
jgi:hypothetical protein